MSENDNEDKIRQVVREELENKGRRSISRESNIFSRTQDIIRNVATDLSDKSKPTNTDNLSFFQNSKKRSVPGHPNRFTCNKRSRGGSVSKSKMFSVVLLAEDLEERETYRIDPESELLSGYVEIPPHAKAEDVVNLLCTVFKEKFPLISKSDFEYVKRSKHTITKPTVPANFKWGYDAIKALSSQGKLYCRLKVSPSILSFDDDFDDSIFETPAFSYQSNSNLQNESCPRFNRSSATYTSSATTTSPATSAPPATSVPPAASSSPVTSAPSATASSPNYTP